MSGARAMSLVIEKEAIIDNGEAGESTHEQRVERADL